MSDRKAAIKVVVLVAALGGLGVAAAVALRKPPTQTARPSEPVPSGGADPSLPRVAVGMVTGYGGIDYVPSGAFDSTLLPPGWSYTAIKRDW